MPLIHESYASHEQHLPAQGKFIIAQFNNKDIILYQAFKSSIAEYAVREQRLGGPDYDFSRSTCFKPSFLWMMYYSGWAKKEDKENILAITVSRANFELLLEQITNDDAEVKLTWASYYDLRGDKTNRQSARLRLSGQTLRRFNDEMILSIENITPYVKEQQGLMLHNNTDAIMLPVERVYTPANLALLGRIKATTITF